MNKKILLWILSITIILGLAAWLTYRFTVEKSLELLIPGKGEVWQAGQTQKISWKSRNIDRVGIILIKGLEGQDVKWLAQDIWAVPRSYDWQIFIWEEPRQDYRIAIFEFPWKQGNKIVYSDDFTVLGPDFASCDSLSVENEWPFMPSDYPDLKKVFITSKNYSGNLERLEGADNKCGQEALEKGFDGNWKAFLGDDTVFAIDRLSLEGIFVEAQSSGSLTEGKSCHRLLGKNFEDFFVKLSDSLPVNQGKFEESFLQNLQNLWLGRINSESTRECTTLFFDRSAPWDLALNYSFTATCQNWTIDKEVVAGYPLSAGQEVEFAACFTPAGVRTTAAALAGLASGVVGQGPERSFTASLGKSCNTAQKLLCVQQ